MQANINLQMSPAIKLVIVQALTTSGAQVVPDWRKIENQIALS